jgi:uncharacterized membrane protein YqhA
MVLLGVLASLAASLLAFLWGAYKTAMVIPHIYESVFGETQIIRVELIAIMDVFLIATALYIFAVGLYSLFIGKVELPSWFECGNLHDLKVALSRVIILVMAVTFLEHLVDWKSASETLMFAAAIAIIMVSLIAYGRWTGQND